MIIMKSWAKIYAETKFRVYTLIRNIVKYLNTIMHIKHMRVPQVMYPQQILEQEHPTPEIQVYF